MKADGQVRASRKSLSNGRYTPSVTRQLSHNNRPLCILSTSVDPELIEVSDSVNVYPDTDEVPAQ